MGEPQNCWEYWNCEKEAREECLVFHNSFGKECWLMTEICRKHESSPKFKKKLKDCFDCSWFKKLNP